MRFSFFLIIILILGACNNSSSGASPVTSPSVEVEQIPKSTAIAGFARATSMTTSTFKEEAKAEEQQTIDRAFEDGLPLVARVNDQPILLKTYEKQVAQFEQALKTQGIDIASDDGQAIFIQTRKQILEGLIEQLIIEQQARNLGILITREEVEAKAQENIAQLQDRAKFEEWLVNNDLAYEEFLAALQSQMVATELFGYITQNVPQATDQIQLQYIRVEEEATAQAIIERLKKGESFAALAQQYSLAKDTGDNLDWFPKAVGLFPSEVETIAFSLQPGEVSGPIQTPLGFYIIQLENKEADRPLTPDMLQILKKQIFDDWLAVQKSSTAIEMYVAQ